MPDAFEQMEQQLRSGVSPVTGKPPTPEEYIQFYSNSPGGPFQQWKNITAGRRALDRQSAEQGTPRDLNMRNAQHYMLTRGEMGGPMGGLHTLAAYPVMGAAVPAYSLLKLLGQKSGLFYTDSTPASWDEVKWGLAPLLNGKPGAPRGLDSLLERP